jgi:hypothetical protein
LKKLSERKFKNTQSDRLVSALQHHLPRHTEQVSIQILVLPVVILAAVTKLLFGDLLQERDLKIPKIADEVEPLEFFSCHRLPFRRLTTTLSGPYPSTHRSVRARHRKKHARQTSDFAQNDLSKWLLFSYHFLFALRLSLL